jgi:hypothetical protein
MNLLDKVFSGKPSPDDFAEMMIRAFHKAGIEQVDPAEGDFSLKLADGVTVFLGNVYADYCTASRSVRQTVIAEFVAAAASIPAMPSIPSDFAAVKSSLMPVMRDAAYFSLVQLMNRKGGSDETGRSELTKPFAGGLVVGLAYDTEHNITSIDSEHLAQWGVSLDDAFKTARENLWDKTDPNRFTGEGGVYWGEWADSYDSSRILLTELIYRLAVDGEPVAFIPNRDQICVTGTNNAAGLAAILKGGAESHFKQGHPLSPDLYVLEDGSWKVHVPEDKSLRELWMSTKRQRDAVDYAQQKELLNEVHEVEDIDIFVASYQIYERKGGGAYSACVWTNGIDSSLPLTENIAFLMDTESGDHFMVPWAAAASVVGDMLEQEADLVPVRYRARQFPNAEQVAKLRRSAVSA